MAFDGIVVSAVIDELKKKILNSKIDKIYQPEKDEIIIQVHNLRKNYKLLASASSTNPRLYLTEYSKSNPSNPPMFCMLLRKHLLGGIIVDIKQCGLDRTIIIDIQSYDEMGEITIKQLIVEIMGKHSNIILIDKTSETIIDSVKRVPLDVSRIRQVLPGLKYEYPPMGDKCDTLRSDRSQFLNKLQKADKNLAVYKFLYTNFIGLSPLISREICFLANIDSNTYVASLSEQDMENLYNNFKMIVDKVKKNDFTPNIIKNSVNYEVFDFHALEINQYTNMIKDFNPSMSNILDEYYHEKDLLDRIGQKSISIKKSIQTKLERSLNKLSRQKEELLEAKEREIFKIYGDLISANIHKIKKGLDNIELENFYSENLEKLIVPLDPKLSASENAQKNYKKYAKLKNAYKLLEEQIPQTEEEVHYLENILVSIENCTELQELEEIKEELINEGYIKGNSKNRKKNINKTASKPHHYISADGYHIYVGKNNKQNDFLTLKLSAKDDIWLHTKNIPGSHVIIKTENKIVPDTTLYEASCLAAFNSKARQSQNVPVDYTERKYVKKPKGSKPGMVIYENNNTIYVTPKREEVEKIKRIDD